MTHNACTCPPARPGRLQLLTGLPAVTHAEELWAIRYILMARAVWLGYNVW